MRRACTDETGAETSKPDFGYRSAFGVIRWSL
jgi:hypothetical protein